MLRAKLIQKEFHYGRPATTSRGTYLTKPVSFIVVRDTEYPSKEGYGECSLFPGLSQDDVPGYGEKLKEIIDLVNEGRFDWDDPLHDWPSIRFGLETARMDLESGGERILYPSAFTTGHASIRTNGLIWMGPKAEMLGQIAHKLEAGFSCLKMKIGAIGLAEELDVLKSIRREYSPGTLELRVDANGAFSPSNVMEVLGRLADLHIHSIEQPIAAGQREEMARICEDTPIPIALDEELIGISGIENRRKLLAEVGPQYIILKPGLLGGIRSAEEWMGLAKELRIGHWVTSALETNIGLNAIAQWTYTLGNLMPQGLSTGSLFTDNIPSPLKIQGEALWYQPERNWGLTLFNKSR